jgi:isopentenyl-diphosphate Delta-isomerase
MYLSFMADELIDICDENNNLTGIKKMKSEAHKKGLWHRSVHVWIYNSKGEIILQLRAKEKPLFPDIWDISVAGHVGAGEEPIISALRELEEEIGLKVKKEDLDFFKFRKVRGIYKNLKNNEFAYIYFFKYDGDIKKLKLQDEELQEIKFFSGDKIKEELKIKPEKFMPLNDYWDEVMDEVKKRTNSLHF